MIENKKLEFFNMKFETSPDVFNESQATDYLRALKESGQIEEATKIANYFLENSPTLLNFRKVYGYMLYEMHINVEEVNEDTFFDALNTITDICKPGPGSPYHATVAKAIRYVTTKPNPCYTQILDVLALENVDELSSQPFVTKDGREVESKKERHYRFLIRALFETSQFEDCIETVNIAYSQINKFHYMADVWMMYYQAMSYLKINQVQLGKKLLLTIGRRIKSIDTTKIIYNALIENNEFKEANTFLIYDFFKSGFSVDMLDLYKEILTASIRTNNQNIINTVDHFINQLCVENGIEYNGLNTYTTDISSSELYDKVYNFIMSNLSLFIDRHQGDVSYYSHQGKYGTITGQVDEDGIFFRQDDYIYDDEVEKRDVVEYSTIPVYDIKKRLVTTRAILIYTTEEYQSFDF